MEDAVYLTFHTQKKQCPLLFSLEIFSQELPRLKSIMGHHQIDITTIIVVFIVTACFAGVTVGGILLLSLGVAHKRRHYNYSTGVEGKRCKFRYPDTCILKSR